MKYEDKQKLEGIIYTTYADYHLNFNYEGKNLKTKKCACGHFSSYYKQPFVGTSINFFNSLKHILLKYKDS